MENLKYKTSIKCNGCVSNVQDYLNNHPNIDQWEVDLNDVDRTLTICVTSIDEVDLKTSMQDLGYSIEKKDV
jgi:copper chaperone CopZ